MDKEIRILFDCYLLRVYNLTPGAQTVQLRGIYQPDNIHVLGWTPADPEWSHHVPGDGCWPGSICMASFQVSYI